MDSASHTHHAEVRKRDKKLHIKLFLLDNINKFSNRIISILGKEVMDDIKKYIKSKSSLGEGDRQILIDILIGISNIEAQIKKINKSIGDIKFFLDIKGSRNIAKKKQKKTESESKKASIADAVNINDVLARLKDEEIEEMLTDPRFDELEQECLENNLDKDCQEYAIRQYVRKVLRK